MRLRASSQKSVARPAARAIAISKRSGTRVFSAMTTKVCHQGVEHILVGMPRKHDLARLQRARLLGDAHMRHEQRRRAQQRGVKYLEQVGETLARRHRDRGEL